MTGRPTRNAIRGTVYATPPALLTWCVLMAFAAVLMAVIA